jgi:hypothetical protein
MDDIPLIHRFLTQVLRYRLLMQDISLCRQPSRRKRIPSEPSALHDLDNEHNDGNHEQKMDQTAAKVADKAQKPKHD